MKLRTSCQIVLAVVVITTMSLSSPFIVIDEASAYTPHAPIYILGNNNFTATNGVTGGAGTSSDPYLIAGWEINASPDAGIVIANTNAHFKIRDVYVHSGSPTHHGIYLWNTSNGWIENTTLLNNWYGIRLWTCLNITVANNNISNNAGDGIDGSSCTNTTLTYNDIHSNGGYGIVFRNSSDIIIADNNISSNDWHGTYLQTVTNATISNNTFTSNGIFLRGWALPEYNSHTVTPDNFVNGKLLHFYKDCNGLDIDGISVGQLVVVNCTAVRAANLQITNTDVGIEMAFVDGATVIGNNVSYNNHVGIFLTYSSNSSIVDNTISNHGEFGIYVERTLSTSILRNIVTWATYVGIRLDDTDDLVLDGNNVSNHLQAVSLDGSINSTISGNKVSNNTEGMQLYATANFTFIDNDVYSNIVGVRLGGSTNTSVIDNRVHSNGAIGMSLGSVDRPRVTGNTFSENREGIELYRVSNATVTANNISSNQQYGIRLHYSDNNTLHNNTVFNNTPGLLLVSSHFNRVYHNNILNNTEQAIDETDTNQWDDGYPSGGNLWSNYTGVDNCSGPSQNICPDPDAIGDTPFVIDADSQDRYPWMFPFGTLLPRPPTDFQATLTGRDLENVTLTWSSSLDDGMGLKSVVNYEIMRNLTYDVDGLGYGLIASLPNGTAEFIDSFVGEGNPDNYYYVVCAIDVGGNSSCAEDQVGKFTRPLLDGQNLVSIPLIQSNESIKRVLQTVKFDKAWTFDVTKNEWKWFMTSKPYIGELGSINHKIGVWVNVTEASNLTVAGIVPMATAIQLRAGWNLLSFPSFDPAYTAGDLKTETGATRVEGFQMSAPPYYLRELTVGDTLKTGYGFWVWVKSDITWTVRNS